MAGDRVVLFCKGTYASPRAFWRFHNKFIKVVDTLFILGVTLIIVIHDTPADDSRPACADINKYFTPSQRRAVRANTHTHSHRTLTPVIICRARINDTRPGVKCTRTARKLSRPQRCSFSLCARSLFQPCSAKNCFASSSTALVRGFYPGSATSFIIFSSIIQTA